MRWVACTGRSATVRPTVVHLRSLRKPLSMHFKIPNAPEKFHDQTRKQDTNKTQHNTNTKTAKQQSFSSEGTAATSYLGLEFNIKLLSMPVRWRCVLRPTFGPAWSQALSNGVLESTQASVKGHDAYSAACKGRAMPYGSLGVPATLNLHGCNAVLALENSLLLVTIISHDCNGSINCGLWWAVCRCWSLLTSAPIGA